MMKELPEAIIKDIEEKIGLSIKEIRSMCPSDMRKYLEKKNKKLFRIIS